MNKIAWVFLILVGYMILSNKISLNEGFENDDDNCEYRKKQKGSKMCGASELSKWGEPPCSSWEISANMKGLSKRKQTVLKGYYPNDFMYEIDYKEYSTSKLVDDTDADDKADTDDKGGKDDEPRGVHSSFFS